MIFSYLINVFTSLVFNHRNKKMILQLYSRLYKTKENVYLQLLKSRMMACYIVLKVFLSFLNVSIKYTEGGSSYLSGTRNRQVFQVFQGGFIFQTKKFHLDVMLFIDVWGAVIPSTPSKSAKR